MGVMICLYCGTCYCITCRHTASGEGGALCESKTGAAAERGVLERDSSQLRREEASLRMAVQQLERDIAQLRENITELGECWLKSRHLSTCNLFCQSEKNMKST